MLSDLNLLPLEDRRRNIRLAYNYKVVEGLVPEIPDKQKTRKKHSSQNF
jgi:hypothetical protein